MDIPELKSEIIARVDQMEDAGILLHIKEILENMEADWGEDSLKILGSVDWDELEKEAKEPITPENILTEAEFMEWRKQMKWM